MKWNELDGATLAIHNANFDCEVLRRLERDGAIPKFERKVVDTADLLSYCGIRRSLQAGMKLVYGVEVSKQVRADMDGKTPEMLSPAEYDALYRYGTDDAIHCYMLWAALGRKWPYVERRMSELNRESNMRGILADVDLVEAGLERLRRIYSDGASKLPWMNAENPENRYPASSCPALARWLEAHGYPIPKSFNKNGNDFMDWKKTLDPEKDAELIGILDARIAVTGTQSHIARLETMLAQVDENSRLHPGFVYFGAHTGRFTAGVAGERSEDNKKSGDDPKNLNLLNMAKKPVYGVDLRAMYVAGPGRKLVIADYSQVEARALLWLVDDEQMCEALADGKSNLYQLTAVKMGWCKPGDDIKHTDPLTYQLAKQCVLGLGYSMGTYTFLLRLEASGIEVKSVPKSEWTADDIDGCSFVFRKQAFVDPSDPADEYRCGQIVGGRDVEKRELAHSRFHRPRDRVPERRVLARAAGDAHPRRVGEGPEVLGRHAERKAEDLPRARRVHEERRHGRARVEVLHGEAGARRALRDTERRQAHREPRAGVLQGHPRQFHSRDRGQASELGIPLQRL